LTSEFLEVLKLEPFDKNGVPISLKIQLNMLSLEEMSRRGSINKIVPHKKEDEKRDSLLKLEPMNKEEAIERKSLMKPTENKDSSYLQIRKSINFNEELKSNKSEEKGSGIDLEKVQLRSGQFYQQKKAFILRNWAKIQEILDFSRFFMMTKNKLIMNREYKLSSIEIDLYQKFIEKLSFYISNKIILNYDSNHPIKLFSLESNSPDLKLLLKQLDFKIMAFILTKSSEVLNEEGIMIKDYWHQIKKPSNKIWVQAKEDFLPIDFIEKYAILPNNISQNSFHTLANYYTYDLDSKDSETRKISMLFNKLQLNFKMVHELQDTFNFKVLKRRKSLKDIYMFGLFKESPYNSFLLRKDHMGFFQIQPNCKLLAFYENMKGYIGDNNTMIVIFCDFMAMNMKIMVLPGIANFVLMSYFDRFSLAYKLTILIYSFLMIGIFILMGKWCFRKVQEFKIENGLLKLQVKNAKSFNFLENYHEKPIIPNKNKGFCFNLMRLLMILYYTFIFLAFFSAKAYITYGFSLLKIAWIKNQTIFQYNKYFDGNHFFPDLFDFLILSLFILIFKKIIISAKLPPYFLREQTIKDWILTVFRVLCEFNGFFQIIFIYPEIDNCTSNDCLTMCQVMYKNRLIFYFFYRGFYWGYCTIKFHRFNALNKSLEKTLLERKAFRDSIMPIPLRNIDEPRKIVFDNKNIINEPRKSVFNNKNLMDLEKNIIDDKNSIENKNVIDNKNIIDPEKNNKNMEINILNNKKMDENLLKPNLNDKRPKPLDLESANNIILETSPSKRREKSFKYLHLCQLTNKLVLNNELDTLFYSNSMLEKSYELYIDFYLILLYIISFSSMFSLDLVFFWVILFFECFYIKYKLLFLYKNFHFQNLRQYLNWKNRLVFLIFAATIFNVGLLAFLYDAFFGYYPVLLFFIIVIFLCLVMIVIFYFFDDISRKMKLTLINNRESLMNLFNFLK